MANSTASSFPPLAQLLDPSTLSGTIHQLLTYLQEPKILASLAISYVVLVHQLRYRRAAYHTSLVQSDILSSSSTAKKPSQVSSSVSATSNSLGGMSTATAQQIFLSLAQLELPFTMETALQFALFRTYGIPSISALLTKTSLFSSAETAHKRYADTAALIIEFTMRDFSSPEAIEALSRLNCIHNTYRRQNKISDADMLYTLALFALQPEHWVARYEWRTFTVEERCAMGVLWKAIGDAMDIPWTGLKTYDEGGKWRDGIHWLEELAEWTEAYEAKYMVPAESNALTAAQTTTILLWNVPAPFKPIGRAAVAVLMDERLRKAMIIPKPSAAMTGFVQGALKLRKFVLRYLALPRPRWLRIMKHEDQRTGEGRVRTVFYQSLPYYMKPTLLNRWGPSAWVSRLMGVPVPGEDKYFPQGFDPRTVGPAVGRSEQDREEKLVADRTRAACPFPKGFMGSDQ